MRHVSSLIEQPPDRNSSLIEQQTAVFIAKCCDNNIQSRFISFCLNEIMCSVHSVHILGFLRSK